MKHLTKFNESSTEKANVQILLDEFEKILKEQESDIMDYMNKYFTKEEATRHSDNIWGYLLKSDGVLATLKLKLASKGFDI